jgi:hypothetical protein
MLREQGITLDRQKVNISFLKTLVCSPQYHFTMFHTHIPIIHIAPLNVPLTSPAGLSAVLDRTVRLLRTALDSGSYWLTDTYCY